MDPLNKNNSTESKPFITTDQNVRKSQWYDAGMWGSRKQIRVQTKTETNVKTVQEVTQNVFERILNKIFRNENLCRGRVTQQYTVKGDNTLTDSIENLHTPDLIKYSFSKFLAPKGEKSKESQPPVKLLSSGEESAPLLEIETAPLSEIETAHKKEESIAKQTKKIKDLEDNIKISETEIEVIESAIKDMENELEKLTLKMETIDFQKDKGKLNEGEKTTDEKIEEINQRINKLEEGIKDKKIEKDQIIKNISGFIEQQKKAEEELNAILNAE